MRSLASLPRQFARQLGLELLLRRAERYDTWRDSALVFAPHQDDETLGCGGTIARKTAVGAVVHVVFMTDGSASHPGKISALTLASERRAEAVRACAALGVDAGRVVFLDFEDGTLSHAQQAAVQRVGELLDELEPDEVFVPFRFDVQTDHVATHRIVQQALASRHSRLRVFEYPVWFWHRWPWVRPSLRQMLGDASDWLQGPRLRHRMLTCAADVRDVLETKRRALEQYESQTKRRAGDAEWAVLGDVARGEWLDCFFAGHELFHARQMPADAGET